MVNFVVYLGLYMKKGRSKSDFSADKSQSLLDCYMNAVGKHGGNERLAILEAVVKMPAPRFWVSEEMAVKVVKGMMSGITPRWLIGTKKRMYGEIFCRTMQLLSDGDARPLDEIVYCVVHSMAPEHYTTPRTAGELIYREIKKRRIDAATGR